MNSTGGYFKESELNTTGCDIWALTKRKLGKDSFHAKIDFPVNYASLEKALDEKAKVYYYSANKKIQAIYVIRHNESSVVCNEIYRSSGISDRMRETMDRQISFLVAKSTLNNGKKAVFDGSVLPLLISKNHISWGIVIALSIGIGACWWICSGSPALAILGFSIGFACGNTTLYKFIEPASGDPDHHVGEQFEYEEGDSSHGDGGDGAEGYSS